MGSIRNGARSFLDLMAKACKLSRLPGFRAGLNTILGTTTAAEFFALWEPLCAFVEVLIGLDNWYNQIDASQEEPQSEDISFA
jgi:hypothetical protein